MIPEVKDITPFSPAASITWAWWSWSVSRKKWIRSCWEANSKEEAIKLREEPLAHELNRYINVLVKEEISFTDCRYTHEVSPVV